MNRVILATIVFMCAYTVTHAQRNVLLIIADDLGTDYCGFSEDAADTARMPNIGALLPRGVRFANAWASPTCSPTRAGILTGRYPFRTGVGVALSGTDYPDLQATEITLAQLLHARTPTPYATANVGKWHLNQRVQEKLNYPALFGYDYYAGNFLGELTDYYNWNKITNGASTTCTAYATTQAVNDAIAWLGTVPTEKPFFLWLAFNAPHTPFHAPPDSLHTVPGLTGTQGHINQNPKLYFKAMIEAMDTETGRLLGWLAAHGRLDSTTIIFIGDNGNVKRVSQIADTAHAKGTLYEYGIRVPFIVAGPDVANPGRVSTALVNTVDIFATVLELCGVPAWRDSIPAGVAIDSRSLMPLLANQPGATRNWIFSEQFTPTPAAADGKAIRNAEYKLIRFDKGGEEFYNVAADPNEARNLLALGRPLSAIEQGNYDTLCNAMNTLLGLAPCTGTVSAPAERAEAAISIVPNPAASRVLLGGLGNWQSVRYAVIATNGTEVQSGSLRPANGTAWLEIPLANGHYMLALTLPNGQRRSLALEIQR